MPPLLKLGAEYEPIRLMYDGKPRAYKPDLVLPNGIVVLVQENHANKTVAITGLLKAGAVFDPTSQPGLAELTAAMLSRGAAGQTAPDPR